MSLPSLCVTNMSNLQSERRCHMVSFHAASIFRSSIFSPQRRHSSRLKADVLNAIGGKENNGNHAYLIILRPFHVNLACPSSFRARLNHL